MPAKRKASAGRQGAAKAPEAGTRRSTRGASATSESKSAVGTKRKASPSPTPAPKKAASAKKGRTRSPSPAPETRPVRGRSASGKKVETKPAEKAENPTSRSTSNLRGRVTRNVVQEEEKKTTETKSRSSSRGAKAPATPKNSATPKGRAVTPSQKVATPKKAETPKQKATPRGRSATPKQTKATPKKAAVTPKQKSTPKEKTTPKQRQQTPKKKSEPATKKETPKSTSKKKSKPESPPKTSRSRRSKGEEPSEKEPENVDLDSKSAATEGSDKAETEVEKEPENVDENNKQSTTEESDKSEMAVDDKPTEENKSNEDTEAGEESTSSEVVTVAASEEAEVKTDQVEEDNNDVEKEEDKKEETETAEETEKEQKSEVVENEDEESDLEKTEEEAEKMQTEDNVEKEEEKEEQKEVQEEEQLDSEREIEKNIEESPEMVEEEMEADDKDEANESNLEKDETDKSQEVKSDEQIEDIKAVKESADEVNLMTPENDDMEKENVDEMNMAEVSATMQQSEDNSVETSEGVTEETSIDLVEDDSKDGVEVISEPSEELSQEVIELNEDSGEAVILEKPAVVNDVINVDDVGNGSGDQELSTKVASVEEISDDDIEEIDTKQNNIQGNGAADANDEIEVIEFVDQQDKYVENCPTKRKFDDVENQEVDDTSPLKKARISTEEEIQENGSNSQEDVSKDYVVIEMGDVPAPDSTEVQSSLPNPIFNRSFIPNPTFTGSSDNSKQFSLVSYNILADCHLFRNDYSFTESKYLQSEYRLKNVIEELKYLDADVVCLQEVDPQFFADQLLPSMRSLGYEGVHKQREDEYYNEGEATFFKTNRFSVVETEASTFSQLLKKELDGIDPDIREAVTKYTDLPDVVIVTKLQCKNTGREVTIGNVHIQWGEMKVPDAQCVQIASAVKEIVSKATGDNFPHIICGDFNSPPMSPGYLVARDGYPSGDETINTLMKIERLELPEGKKASLVNSLWPAFQHTSSSLRSAYSEAQGYEPEISSYNCVMCDTVDYVFYSSMSLENVGVLQTAAKEKVMETGGIPNRYFPSDHISLKAILSFK